MENKVEKINITVIVQFITIFITVVYLIGFVVVNTYLSGTGVFRFEIINSQYLSAGVLTLIVFIIFGLLVGRKVYYVSSDFIELEKLVFDKTKPLKSFLWRVFSFLYILIEIYFSIVFGVYLTANIFFENFEADFKLDLIIFGLFVVDYYFLWRNDLYNRNPFIILPLVSAFFIITIYFFLKDINDSRVILLLFIYVSMAIILYFVLDFYEFTYEFTNGKNYLVLVITIILTFIILAVFFGKTLYGEVKRGLGGGKPMIATLVVNDQVPQVIDNILEVKNNITSEIELYSETTSDLILKITKNNAPEKHDQFLRLNKSLVMGILPKDKSN